MGKRRNFKKIKLPPFVGGLKDALMQKVLTAGVIIIFIVVALVLVKAFLYRSDYFKLRRVEIRDTFLDKKALSSVYNYLFGSYKGKNIFRISLKAIDRYLQVSYPDAREVYVGIALPDKLVVKMKFRKPVALIRTPKLYAVDEDGFILPTANADLLKDLPVIDGVSVRYDQRRAKQTSPQGQDLKIALELLKEIRASRFMADYGVAAINAEDRENLSFNLKNGVEVRIGCEDFRGGLAMLEQTLRDPRLLLDKIKYIDVRFKDVVIGPK